MTKALLIGNPTASTGRAARAIGLARTALSAAGVDHDFMPTEPHGLTTQRLIDFLEGSSCRLVIALGGDGTFAEVAKGILRSTRRSELVLGMLPNGTANDQGKSFGLRAGLRALPENARIIARGKTAGLDAGHLDVFGPDAQLLHSDMFFDSFSIGIAAATLTMRNRDKSRIAKVPLLSRIYRSQAVYAGALVRRMLHSTFVDQKFDLVARIDGQVWHYESLLDVVIKNTRVFSGDWVLDKSARADDGLFELIPIMGRIDLTTKILTTFRLSPVTEDSLRMLGLEREASRVGSRFELEVYGAGGRRIRAQVDGEEIVDGSKYLVQVLPRALTVLVP